MLYNSKWLDLTNYQSMDLIASLSIKAPSTLSLFFDRSSSIEYRKRDASGNKTKEMDRERMSVLDFIARFCQHIPEAGQQMVRYYGICSNKSRGMRKKERVPEFMLVEDDESHYGRN